MNRPSPVCIIFLLFLISIKANAQSRIDGSNFEVKYLEHLVKKEVDLVRAKYDCKPLINDSILYVASQHHSNYMSYFRRLTHNENDSTNFKTPQLRAEAYGAINYLVGENVLYSTYNSIIKGKTGGKFDTHTYEELAKAMVNSWVNSPGHFKNMITPEYQITGVSLSIDPKTKRVYCCQKFAQVPYQYTFTENKEMFPNSDYIPSPPTTSFNDIPRELINPHKYDYNLKHNRPQKCEPCSVLVATQPFLTLRIERNNFILRIENADYVKDLITNSNDGFAVEIVSFDDYMCGNPEYFTKPSRRNNQLRINGKILKPVYRNQLAKGFKKRKKIKGIKMSKFLFGKNDIPFFKRANQWKLRKYKHEYFEIKLGRVPKDLNGLWNHNLLTIKNKQICHIDYFTNYCGDLKDTSIQTNFIPLPAVGEYDFPEEQKEYEFTIHFEQGKSEFTKSEIYPFIQSMTNLSIRLDSIQINAFASVEGDSISNHKLQKKRAQNIALLIQEYQKEIIPVTIETKTDWNHFNNAISRNPELNYLSSLNGAQLQSELFKNIKKLEPILEEERRATITVKSSIRNNLENLEYNIEKEWKRLINLFDNDSEDSIKITTLNEIERLYDFMHYHTVNQNLKPDFFSKFKLPETFDDDHELTQKFVYYGKEFKDAFQNNPQWQKGFKLLRDFVFTNCEGRLIDGFIYNYAEELAKEGIKNQKVDTDIFERVIGLMNSLEKKYDQDSIYQKNIDKILFNLNYALLNYGLNSAPLGNHQTASKAIKQIHNYYLKYHPEFNKDQALHLAKTAVFYNDLNQAISILHPFDNDDQVLYFSIPLGYQHSTSPNASEWYLQLIDLSQTMNSDLWCNMFMNECKIPFQAFDHEELRNVFCKKCLSKNKTILELKGL